jgi:hypothetical protein
VGHLARIGNKIAVYKIVTKKKASWKLPHGRLRGKSEDNIKTDLNEIRCEDVDRINLA